jgi:hypothetical protein
MEDEKLSKKSTKHSGSDITYTTDKNKNSKCGLLWLVVFVAVVDSG